jgi:hypothetical protein
MPNWCSNNLVLTHEDPAMIQRAFDALERGEFLQEFIPVPQALRDTVADGSTNEQMVEKHGYSSWYDYCVSEWGTKWDCGEQGASDIHPGGTMLHTFFDTAWSPPVHAYEKLEALGFGVNAMFYEGGMGYAGTYSDGNCDDVDLSELSADDIERDYPELDECFGISESMRELEEPEEELTTWLKEGGEKLGLVKL